MTGKIIIVDDDKEFLEELGESLSSCGFDMVAFNDPLSALSGAAAIKPRVIVLDLKMPQMDGFQLADEIKHLADAGEIPIIAMSAYFKDEYTSLMHMCGITRCLKKPFKPEELIFELRSILEDGQPAQ